MNSIPPSKDKPLFTPGPLTTSQTVKQAMLRDLGSRDVEFIQIIRNMRNDLLDVAGVSTHDGYECVLLQGSGTFGVEAVMTCAVPRDGKWLIVINGAYGDRMKKIADVNGISTAILKYNENEPIVAADVDRLLAEDTSITGVAVVHCETTTGIMNPIEEVGQVVRRHNRTYFVDSMSAFGAVEFDFQACEIDYLVSSANKCIEGVPGFSFCIARRSQLEQTEGWSRTLSFDLLAQWKGLEGNGQFRFTPPTHTMLAFSRALEELKQEGGVAGRQSRYQNNCKVLLAGMRQIGFETYLPDELQGHIITSFLYPTECEFDFELFYGKLNDLGYVIYPGKVSNADCFRIGNIGRVFEADVRGLLAAVESVSREMQLSLNPSLASSAG